MSNEHLEIHVKVGNEVLIDDDTKNWYKVKKILTTGVILENGKEVFCGDILAVRRNTNGNK